jgi:hypothetical protein
MIKFIFVLYRVAGCELSHPSHRINSAYDTIDRCQKAKVNLEAMSHAIYSCERVVFEEDKKTAGASSAEPVESTGFSESLRPYCAVALRIPSTSTEGLPPR